MARSRTHRDKTRALERRLGWFTDKGLRRLPKALWPPKVEEVLKKVDKIKYNCLDIPPKELRSHASFDGPWRKYFFRYGPDLWPEPGANVRESAPVQDPDLYPKRLVFDDIEDQKK